MRFYQLDTKELQNELETDFEYGLTKQEVKSRYRICGYNTRFIKPKLTPKSFCLPLLVISLIISIVYVIFAIFNRNITFTFYAIASAVLAILCQLIILFINYFLDSGVYLSSIHKPYTLTAIRDGVKCQLKYNEIVYGDIVFVEKGDYIPFDGIILSSNGLVTDESDITGKDRVSKHPGVIYKDNVTPDELSNTIFCYSYVVHGKAKVVVTDVSSRVYISKSGKLKNSGKKIMSKALDISTMFLTIFSVFCIIFTVICGLISKDYVGIINSFLIFAIVITSGFMKTSCKFIYKRAFINLCKKGVFLKKYTDIESLNNSDVLLINNNYIFNDKVEISGFISENLEFTSLADVAKNNFSVFLYAAFSLFAKSSEQISCVKILKKIGVDFSDFNSMCPVLTSHYNESNGVNICARAYEGNNMVIASGDYSIIKSMCSNAVDTSEIKKLNSLSTEMVAVAIKNVDIVPDDLTEQTDGFTLVGVVGLNRSIDENAQKKIELLNNCGVHPIILFSGNKRSVSSTFSKDVNCVSVNEISGFSKADFEKIDCIYDYDGTFDEVTERLAAVGLSFCYVGDKINQKHSVSFKNVDNKPLLNKDADVVVANGFDSVFKSLILAKKSGYTIKKIFGNYSLFCAFYVICGVLFSILYKNTMMNTISLGLSLLIILPISLIIYLTTGISDKEISQNSKSNEILGNDVLSYVIISSSLFLLLCTCLKFICSAEIASAFLLITFVTYICFDFDYIKVKTINSIISLIPSIILSIIFALPISFLFGYSSFGIVGGIIAIVVGVLLKCLSTFISRSVKI